MTHDDCPPHLDDEEQIMWRQQAGSQNGGLVRSMLRRVSIARHEMLTQSGRSNAGTRNSGDGSEKARTIDKRVSAADSRPHQDCTSAMEAAG